ncbi:MAG TPA: tagaturonate epimerase family protein [Anaerolineae bacterium]|nr:tagaturonate epimerase family protein [Anaerolineae bacterium]
MDLDQTLKELAGLTVYPRSVVQVDGTTYFLARGDEASRRVLGVLGDTSGFEGARHESATGGDGGPLLCPLTPGNAAVLRGRLRWLRPVPLGLKTSAGFGDRLGLATPGHVWAARQFSGIASIFAQQSVRENARTGRTPQGVVDDATWGIFQEGWREPWGADADHLKTPAAVDAFVAAGYTLYTIDPGDHVDNAAHTAPPAEVEAKAQTLPWDALEDTALDMERRYLGRSFDLGDTALTLDREPLWRAAAKYGRAIAHTVRMYRYLADRMGGNDFELEVSVDETETPTSPAEHLFIASELRRLGVRWASLAPRYVGRFEKGVDYIGDLIEFETELAKHAAIARALGPYKLSIHSGSDKFSIYPIIARLTHGLVHLKTAGTSYLEALRAISQADPGLFRQILGFARERYDGDRATYHVSAQLANVPVPDGLRDEALPGLLEQFDARQVLHVTFGSVLDRFGGRLLATLEKHEEVYYSLLESHFERHLSPFIA